jgi:hypothetical protein
VFSVPSVSLWAAEEFNIFIRPLQRKQIIIVPDADWFTKPEVLRHARMAQRFLQRRGVETYVAAPPQLGGHKGVDDYLGDGKSLNKLEVLERKPSAHARKVLEEADEYMRIDGWHNMAGLLHDIAFFADRRGPKEDENTPDEESKAGYVYATHETLAKILNIGSSTVSDHLHRMRDHGWITIEHICDGEWVDTEKIKVKKVRVDEKGRVVKFERHFEHITRLRVRADLRGIDERPFSLGELETFKERREQAQRAAEERRLAVGRRFGQRRRHNPFLAVKHAHG